jgi:hypothetical protein
MTRSTMTGLMGPTPAPPMTCSTMTGLMGPTPAPMTCSTMTGLLAATGTADDPLDDDPADHAATVADELLNDDRADGIAPARRCCREGKAPLSRSDCVTDPAPLSPPESIRPPPVYRHFRPRNG